MLSSRKAERTPTRARVDPPVKKKVSPSAAWREARELIWAHRRRLLIGMVMMLIGRGAGLVLPARAHRRPLGETRKKGYCDPGRPPAAS